jgi:hypothetical protein
VQDPSYSKVEDTMRLPCSPENVGREGREEKAGRHSAQNDGQVPIRAFKGRPGHAAVNRTQLPSQLADRFAEFRITV